MMENSRYKFRAWFNEQPEWANQLFYSDEEGALGDFFSECQMHMDKTGGGCFEQYTGLKDKNGVEIYEGDIVRFVDFVDYPSDEEAGVIEHHSVRCALMVRDVKTNHRGGRYWRMWDQLQPVEIIGNIHENKDLLK